MGSNAHESGKTILPGQPAPSDAAKKELVAEEVGHQVHNPVNQQNDKGVPAFDPDTEKRIADKVAADQSGKSEDVKGTKKDEVTHVPKMISDPTIRPTPNPGTEGDSPPPVERPAPENTGCICDSLSYNLTIKKVHLPKNGNPDTTSVHDAVQRYTFSDPPEGTETEIPVSLSQRLLPHEHFLISFSDVKIYCHCVNNTTEKVPCQVYKRISGVRGDPGARVSDLKKDKINVKKIELINKETEQFIFKMEPDDDSRKNRGFCEIKFEVFGACFSDDCDFKGKVSAPCERVFKIKISNP